ncbi:DUF952 domain-containing protein [Brachybacterium huguangmaarense]|uniref:DUF952 domain-containing protein n=1 Tax=Brachybacterium huguangmaarense TaxID=1652028 RepID=A0ABY6G0H6_9MICO|nr:DUF952 domain-containing protein [Brachybacterium huguangmaarense]UYG16701.1 DUF952 domain-containing protein [Brachybacterium huguangmaarense]
MPAPLIWHITELGLWEDGVLAGRYTASTRGRDLAQEGYIHASWPEQISAVARRVYPDRPDDLVILEIDVDRVEAAGMRVEFEPGTDGDDSEQTYPHVLGPIPIDAVLRLRRTKWVGREFVVIA